MSESLSRNTRNDPSNSVTQIYPKTVWRHKLVYKQSCTIQIWNSSEKTVEIDPILVHAIDPKVTSFGEIAVVFGSFGSKMGEKSIRQSHHPEIMQDHQDESASGQIIIFHTPRFPWNSRGFLETSATFWRPRSVREVAIIWRKSYINSWHGLVFTFHLMIPPPLTLRDLRNGVSPPKINHDNNSDVIKKTDNLQGRGDVISPIFIHFPLYKLVPPISNRSSLN